jgi:hypothetical protein
MKSNKEPRGELLDQLGRLDSRIDELRGAQSLITYDFEWAVKERDRLRRHLSSLTREEGGA